MRRAKLWTLCAGVLGIMTAIALSEEPLGAAVPETSGCENDVCNMDVGNCEVSTIAANCGEVPGGCQSKLCDET